MWRLDGVVGVDAGANGEGRRGRAEYCDAGLYIPCTPGHASGESRAHFRELVNCVANTNSRRWPIIGEEFSVNKSRTERPCSRATVLIEECNLKPKESL